MFHIENLNGSRLLGGTRARASIDLPLICVNEIADAPGEGKLTQASPSDLQYREANRPWRWMLTLDAIIAEMRGSTSSERQGRVIDHDEAGSMEKKKREGYF